MGAAARKTESINIHRKSLKVAKKVQEMDTEIKSTEKNNYLKNGNGPKWLNAVGRYHYKKLVQSLKDVELYNPLDVGLIEQAAAAYSESRDASLSFKERQSARDQYARLVGQLGERGGVKATLEEVGSEDDLKEFILG